ncbi:MAG TPA: polysaccharide deacetylase family protein [Thermoanaerobaculia bacterium]|nr:polysaccharide deacetylase family protein [Thermoanaerobaculia bacterium]
MDPNSRRRGTAPFLLGSAGLHAGAALALLTMPRNWLGVAAVLLADHLAVVGAGLWPRSRLLGPNLSRLPAPAARRGEVALSFDDGPDSVVTPPVLELLDRHRARATFFCIGRRVDERRELAAEIARRGHLVENHSYSHPGAFACYMAGGLRRQIRRAQEAIELATGRRPRLFRAPAGLRNFLLEGELRKAGLLLASWNRRGFDTICREPEKVARRLLTNLAAGDIVLLHDGSAARDARGTPVVLEVLPRLLDELAARGLRAVPLEAGVRQVSGHAA